MCHWFLCQHKLFVCGICCDRYNNLMICLLPLESVNYALHILCIWFTIYYNTFWLPVVKPHVKFNVRENLRLVSVWTSFGWMRLNGFWHLDFALWKTLSNRYCRPHARICAVFGKSYILIIIICKLCMLIWIEWKSISWFGNQIGS